MRDFPFWRGAIYQAENLQALKAIQEEIANFQREPVFYNKEPKLSEGQVRILNNLFAEKMAELLTHGAGTGKKPGPWGVEAPGAYTSGENREGVTILMAEDDADDRFLFSKALETSGVKNPFVTVSNGEELLDYLYRRGKFSGPNQAPTPCFILLDLNMPRMDGREALRAIKSDENLRKIPVVVLTTSRSEEDISNGYARGANSYITKPLSFDGLVKIIQVLRDYWLDVVQLPVKPIQA